MQAQPDGVVLVEAQLDIVVALAEGAQLVEGATRLAPVELRARLVLAKPPIGCLRLIGRAPAGPRRSTASHPSRDRLLDVAEHRTEIVRQIRGNEVRSDGSHATAD